MIDRSIVEKPMDQVVTATEARVKFGELMRRVAEGRGPIVVAKDGEPMVVIVSLAEYTRLTAREQEPADWLAKVDSVRRMIAADLGGPGVPAPPGTLPPRHGGREGPLLQV